MCTAPLRRSILVLALLLGGCVAPRGAVEQPAPVAAAPRYSPVGLENVIGRTARHLETVFGPPELDVREGSARKLQYTSQVCVLDAYLYPPKAGGDSIVTYVDARLPDGRDLDRASCVAALQQARKTR